MSSSDEYAGYTATEAAKKYLYDNCVKKLEKGDVWKVALKNYHLKLKVSATKSGDSYIGFLRYSIKGLDQWTDFVANTNSRNAEDAKLLALMQFLSYLKQDEINEKFFHKAPTNPDNEQIMMKTEPNSYSVEFELDAMMVGPPNDHKLTPRITVVKPDGHSPPGFRVTVIGEAKSEDQAVNDARNVLNEFLDHYCLRTKTAIQIGNNGIPHMIIYGGKIVMPIDLSNMKLFIPDRKGFEFISKNIDDFRKNEYKYIRNAMNYYRKGKYADAFEGKLVNFFIALEALYSSNDAEIRYRFSIRLAVMLGITSEEIITTFDNALDYYKKRSITIHGEETKINQEIINKIDDWVRKSILYFIELSKNHTTRDLALKFLDKAIIDFESRQSLQKQTESVREFLRKVEEERKKIEETTGKS
ncbi:MAG: hypothetical protein ACREBJ_02260 [Nitrosotalea sp.]